MSAFGFGASQTEQQDKSFNGKLDASGDNSLATGLSNINTGKNSTLTIGLTDYGSIKGAFNFGTDALGVASDALSNGFNLAGDFLNTAASFVDKAASDKSKSDAMTTEFLGSVTDWSKTASQNMLEVQKGSFAQDRYFLDAVVKENQNNRNLIDKTNTYLNTAWSQASDNMVALSSDFLKATMATQNSALNLIDKNSQAAQSATLSAMTKLFDSTKSDVERVASDGIKYIFFGVVALVGLPILAGVFGGRSSGAH